MYTRKKGVNTTVLFIVIITVIVSYCCVKNQPRATGRKLAQLRRVRLLYHTDHDELLKAERQIEELSSRVKRSFYVGRPTRKYRRLIRMQNRLNMYLDSPALWEMLRK